MGVVDGTSREEEAVVPDAVAGGLAEGVVVAGVAVAINGGPVDEIG